MSDKKQHTTEQAKHETLKETKFETSNQSSREKIESSQDGLEHPSYKHLEEKLTLAEQTAHEHWEKSVRALAELENVRRRAERDVAQAHRYSLEKFARELLPVMDSLEQALQLANQEAKTAMGEGLELTVKLFLNVLEKFEVQQINPIEAMFNPQEHEAMSMQETDEAKPNTVLAVFQKGYKLHDRIIRPARVVVAKEKMQS